MVDLCQILGGTLYAPLADNPLADELERLEETYATNPEFIDRAAHLLLVGAAGEPLRPLPSRLVGLTPATFA